MTNPNRSVNIGNMIPRLLEKVIHSQLISSSKIIIVLGARQVGKTTLMKSIKQKLETDKKQILYLNCDIEEERLSLDSTSKISLEQLILNKDYLFIDEAQRLSNPGLTLKIIHDNFPKVKVFVTGSSSFELKNKLSDPLTGRYFDYYLYPLSLAEILEAQNSQTYSPVIKNQANALLEKVLLYGFYPEVFAANTQSEKQTFLSKITESYLFRDILSFEKIRNSAAIKNLTSALAYQIVSEINENELATRIKIDRKTVLSYLDILEKTFVIKKVYPYSKNPRREIGRNYKVYFIDLGLRNALIGDFNSLDIRLDQGAIWENFLFIERIKYYANKDQILNFHFWRSYSGAEIDYLEKPLNKNPQAFEFKLNKTNLSRGAYAFSLKYKIPVKIINRDNYFDFISGKI